MFASNTSQVSGDAVFVEDVFQNWLYTGNDSSQTITNGIDLAGKGGLVWMKSRSQATRHCLFDTARGAYQLLSSDQTFGSVNSSPYDLSAFNNNGFTLQQSGYGTNASGQTYASWTFRKQPKFFDVVTFTTPSTAGSFTVSHSLGAAPGFMAIKSVNTVDSWYCYHQSLGVNQYVRLDADSAAVSSTGFFGTVGSTEITLSTSSWGTSITYVAYLFAHNAGGFGLTGTDNVVSCGSYTGTGASFGPQVDLGFEPQFVMIKAATTTGSWAMFDNMRGIQFSGPDQRLYANTSDAEATTGGNGIEINATGFRANETFAYINGSGQTYIYIAIRRGPMKTPTSGTSVFAPVTATGTGSIVNITTGFPVDLVVDSNRTGSVASYFMDRLRGGSQYNYSQSAAAEGSYSNVAYFDRMTNYGNNNWGASTGSSIIDWCFRRAPGFFDEVCYTGDGTGNARSHNLTVYPELVISKLRSGGAGFGAWNVQNNINPSAKQTGFLNTTAAFSSSGATSPTANVFYPTDDQSGATYVAYLFASCPGVSKVGSYTGNGNTAAQGGQTINCGFTGSARFILIKCTSSAENWYVYDSARGIVTGNDPSLTLNTTEPEDTGYDAVDAVAGGFIVNNNNASNLNTSGQTYIYLAIA